MPPFRVAVVLSHPSHPGNVGSTSRAMKTMGFSDLRLVDAPAMDDEGRALSAGAIDVLEGAQRHDTLESAIADCSLAVAFTARARGLSRDAMPIRALAADIVAAARDSPVALVFGNETSGLSNEEVGRCQRIATIPANDAYSSLNLAAAVQVACYEVALAGAILESTAREPFEAATGEDLEKLFAHFETAMHESGYLDSRKPGRLMERLRRLFGRTRLERSEVKVLRGMLEAFEKKMRP